MQTAIETTGRVTCPDCGVLVELEMSSDIGFVSCECGKSLRYRRYSPTAMSALEACGYNLSIDWDGALLVDSQDELTAELREWLFHNQCTLRSNIEFRGKQDRARYMGGAKNGERHGHSWRGWGRGCKDIFVHVGRAHWETYRFRERDDPRLFYIGRSTSKKNALQGCFIEVQK